MSSGYNKAKYIFSDYKANCKRLNVFWDLTLEEVQKLTSDNCHYCNRPPFKERKGYKYNGIDRINKDRGYYPENVVSACWICNKLKSDKFSEAETKVMISALKEYRRTQSNPE